MHFPLIFHFHDSEVARIDRDGANLTVLFSAARVVQTDPQTRRPTEGHALGLVVQLIGVLQASAAHDCIGRLVHGSLSVGGPAQASLPLPQLPFEWAGQSTITLGFAHGVSWSAQALKLCFDWQGEPRLCESVAC